ncbi:unnamed protein product [Eruca vesicaria subsp. sativa]|uniref:PUM-HD domain-containing protein n=1 Tax=Eruca vesicaria subsp. sativa TaxID=29727 RepID=A0ABC8M3G7_ERUVS|nr:unnamed protein product [Eruca vesicaria subsp. sativa]
MDPSRVNNTNGESNGRETTEENQTPANRRGASQQPQPSQPQPITPRSIFASAAAAELKALESSFGSLSFSGSRSVPHQNQFLANRWTNGSSSSSSPLNGGAGDVHHSSGPSGFNYYYEQDFAYEGPLVYQNGNGTYSKYSHWASDNNGFGSVMSNSSWRRNQGSLNNSHSFGNPRMRSIASLAKDQGSSVDVQRKISEGSKETIDLIFEGVIFHFCELMVDPYGHKVLSDLMVRCSSEQISRIVDLITQRQFRFVNICTDPVGAISVKSLLRCLQSEEQILRVVRAVSLGAIALTKSSNALVILQCFKQFHPSHTTDLLAVIAENCYAIATDEYGCRMLQQCLDTGCNVVKQRLIQEIIANALRLCVNSYGNYVVQYLVELGDPNVTIPLIRQLLGSYSLLARNKFASHVVQKFLKIEYIDPSLIVVDLLRDIDTLLLDPFGNYVIQTAWMVCKDDLRMILMGHINRNKRLMRCNMYGNKVLERLNL